MRVVSREGTNNTTQLKQSKSEVVHRPTARTVTNNGLTKAFIDCAAVAFRAVEYSCRSREEFREWELWCGRVAIFVVQDIDQVCRSEVELIWRVRVMRGRRLAVAADGKERCNADTDQWKCKTDMWTGRRAPSPRFQGPALSTYPVILSRWHPCSSGLPSCPRSVGIPAGCGDGLCSGAALEETQQCNARKMRALNIKDSHFLPER